MMFYEPLILLQTLLNEFINLLPQIILMFCTAAITYIFTKNRQNAEIKKLLGEVDSTKLKDLLTLFNLKDEQMQQLLIKNEKLEESLRKAEEALFIAQKESREFKAAYNIYKNYKK